MSDGSALMNGLTREQVQEAAGILNNLDGTGIPSAIYEKIRPLVITVSHECVILRLKGNRVEILLIERESTDGFWPSMLHCPGGAERPIDYVRYPLFPQQGVYERIQRNELRGIFFDRPPEQVAIIRGVGDAGAGLVFIDLCSIPADAVLPPGAGWYPADSLDTLPNFIRGQLNSMNIAIAVFKIKHGINMKMEKN